MIAKPAEQVQIRIAIFSIAVIIVIGMLLGRLWYLQVLTGNEYKVLAEENRIRTISIDPPRGIIYDRNKKVLVKNRPSLAVTLSPDTAKKNKDIVKKVAEILKMTPKEVRKKLREKREGPLEPRVIQTDVDESIVSYIKEHQSKLPGVEVKVISVREYPSKDLAAHALGYVGEISEDELEKPEYNDYVLGDAIGKSGAECEYESALRGVKGEQQVEVNAAGRKLRVIKTRDFRPGNNLVLTIDKKLQKATEEALEGAARYARGKGYSDAKAGAAIVIEPDSGKILAMASYPTFDPRVFIGGIKTKQWQELNDKDSNYPLINRTMMSSYAPGSTFKPFTALAGMKEGIISPKTAYACGGKWLAYGKKWVKYCWKRSGHGRVNLNRALVESCDIYFYEVGNAFYKIFKKDKRELLQDWMGKFGFGSKTGAFEMIPEESGRVPDAAWKKKWNKNHPEYQLWLPGDTVNIGFGQGDLLVTPLQLAIAYGAIANGGTLYQPRLIEKTLTPDGEIARRFKNQRVRKLDFSPEQLKSVQTGLKGVTSSGGGTAAPAFSGFPVPVAGKTGTAQVRGKDDYAWFVCYAPSNDPQYVVVVMVEQGGHGGSVAAPAARKILSEAFKIESSGPDVVDDPSR